MKECSATLLKNPEGKFLLYLRDNKPTIPYPDTWAFLGGHMEENENPEQTVRRELLEEINYPLGKIEYIGGFDDLLDAFVYIYISKINKRVDELILTEGQRLEYFNFQEMLSLKIPDPLRDFLIKNEKQILDYGINQK